MLLKLRNQILHWFYLGTYLLRVQGNENHYMYWKPKMLLRDLLIRGASLPQHTVNLNLAMSGLLAISFLNHWLGRYDDQLIIAAQARRSYYRPLQHKISHKMMVGQVRLLAGKRLRSMARFIYFTIKVRIEKCASFSVH